MNNIITITKEEAEIFRSFIVEKIGEYAKHARTEADNENEAGFQLWAGAAAHLEILERSICERLEVSRNE